MAERINYIDRMKGFVILVVVMAHVLLFSLDMENSLMFRFCASFEMPLFMFLSGYVAYISSKTSKEVISKKLKRRFFSYLFPAFSLSYILALYHWLILDGHINFFYTLTNGLWYLKVLAIFVCLQAIIVNCKKTYMEFIVFFLAECIFFVGWKWSPFLNSLLNFNQAFLYYPFFVMGEYFRRYSLIDYLKNRNWIFTISIIGFICLLNLKIEVHILKLISDGIIRPVCAVLAITYLFAVREYKDSKIEHWLNGIGTKTLDIYMYHGIFFSGAYSCVDLSFVKRNDFLMANPLLCLMIVLIVTMFSTYMSIYVGYLVKKSRLLDKVVYGHFFQAKG